MDDLPRTSESTNDTSDSTFHPLDHPNAAHALPDLRANQHGHPLHAGAGDDAASGDNAGLHASRVGRHESKDSIAFNARNW
jgi:hypothetical protein